VLPLVLTLETDLEVYFYQARTARFGTGHLMLVNLSRGYGGLTQAMYLQVNLSKGYGYVEFAKREDAEQAMQHMHGVRT
jgi:hypothetical protein